MADIHDLTILDLERQLLAAGPRSRFKDNPSEVTNTIRPLIRSWLEAKGVPPGKVYGTPDRDTSPMSDYSLANAWAIGDPYINKIKQGDSRRRPYRNYNRAVDVDLFGPNELDNVFKPAPPIPNSTQEGWDNNNDDWRAKDGSLHPAATIDHAAIARAAEAVITPRLAEATKALRAALGPMVSDEVQKVIEASKDTMRLLVMDTTKASIDAVLPALLEKLVPRKIEITQNNQIIRQLPAEPRHEAFNELLSWFSQGCHVYSYGPAGSGKTHLGKQLADALGLDFYPIDQSLTKYDVKGYKGPTGEYVDTLVRQCVEKGGFLMIDEGDTWAAAALMSLNSILANAYGAFPDKVVQVHPDFRCFLCANTTGKGADRQYVGRNPLDAASRDRFVFVPIAYDEALETALYGNGPWVQYVHKVRKAVETLKLQHIVSSRAITKGLKGEAAGLSYRTVAQRVLWQDLEPDSIAKIKNIAGDVPAMPIDERKLELDDLDGTTELNGAGDHYNDFIAARDNGSKVGMVAALMKQFRGTALSDLSNIASAVLAGQIPIPTPTEFARLVP